MNSFFKYTTLVITAFFCVVYFIQNVLFIPFWALLIPIFLAFGIWYILSSDLCALFFGYATCLIFILYGAIYWFKRFED